MPRLYTPFPILTTEQLTLRQLSIDDQQNIFALRSDAELNRYLDREPCHTMEDAINFINKVNENSKKNNSVYWVITLANTKTFVGTICLFAFSDETNSCEIGYELMMQFQGKGIMKAAAEKVIEYAFMTLKIQKIMAHTHKNNSNSVQLLTRLNFLQADKAYNQDPEVISFSLTN